MPSDIVDRAQQVETVCAQCNLFACRMNRILAFESSKGKVGPWFEMVHIYGIALNVNASVSKDGATPACGTQRCLRRRLPEKDDLHFHIVANDRDSYRREHLHTLMQRLQRRDNADKRLRECVI